MEKIIVSVTKTDDKGMSVTTNGSVGELLLAIGGQIDVLAKSKGVNPLSVAAMALTKYSEHEPTIKED